MGRHMAIGPGRAGKVYQTRRFCHAKIGWHQFTDAVIQKVSDEKEGIVFLLWGSFAHQKQELIDQTKHHEKNQTPAIIYSI